MSKFGKILWGTLIVSLLMLLSIAFFSNLLIHNSLPKYSGSYRFNEVKSNIRIYRDDYGVPHLIATNDEDLFFGAGFVHAQDRLWQLWLLRQMANGRLSEIFGEKTHSLDYFIRTIGIQSLTPDIVANLSPESITMLTRYVNGINACIDVRSRALPIEFVLNEVTPSHWTIHDVITVHRFVSFCIAFFSNDDLLRSIIASKADPVRLRELSMSTSQIPGNYAFIDADNILGIHTYLQSIREQLNELLPIEHKFISWAVNAGNSASKKTVLSQTIDVIPSATTIFHEIHLISPLIDYLGYTIPGIPIFLEGNTRYLSWSANSLPRDEIDYFIEQVESNQYRYKSRWTAMSSNAELIKIRGLPEDTLWVRRTHHGPILSDIVESFDNSKFVLSFNWTGYSVSDEFKSAYELLHIRTGDQFLASIQYHKFPGMEFIYADDQTQIGHVLVPITTSARPMFVSDGTISENRPKDPLLPDQFAFSWSADSLIPESDLNMQRLKKLRTPLQDNKFIHYRYDRINKIVTGQTTLDLSEIFSLQQDSYSSFIKLVNQSISEEILQSDIDERFKLYFHTMFEKSDFYADHLDIATSICHVISKTLLKNIVADELGDALYKAVASNSFISADLLVNILKNPASEWYDNINTSATEQKSDIMRASIADAFNFLNLNYGILVDEWRWGKMTALNFNRHYITDSLKYIPPPKITSSLRGYGDSIFSTVVDYTDELCIDMVSGLARISDRANKDYCFSVMYAGQSDQIISDHYFDQFTLWQNGSFKKCRLSESNITDMNFQLLVLKPE